MLPCCSLCAFYSCGTSSYKEKKKGTHGEIFFFFCLLVRMCKGKKNPTPNASCYNLYHLELQWISVYFSPKGLTLIILFLKIPFCSLWEAHWHSTSASTKCRSLAHSCCKIKGIQSHTSPIKTVNVTGFRRISQQLKINVSGISFTDSKVFTLRLNSEFTIFKSGECTLVLSRNSFWKAVSIPAGM